MDDTVEDRSRASKRSLESKPNKKKEKKSKKTSRRKHLKTKSRKRDVSSSSGSSSSPESSKEERTKKRKKISRKSKSKKEKVNQKASSSEVVEKTRLTVPVDAIKQPVPDVGPHIDLHSSKSRAPMTKEEYERQQSTLKWVIDPETGRKRLIRGSGEVVEEIVSRERHQAINRQATVADGNFFQTQANLKARSSYD